MNKTQLGIISAALVTLVLTAPSLSRLPAAQARADGYAVQEDPAADAASRDLVLNGVISSVDVDRDRVMLDTADGRRYTLDTFRSDITLLDSNRAGQTADLQPGMRLQITGVPLSGDIIEADRVRVLRDAADTPALQPAPSLDDVDSINLRGTVESVDQGRGSFVVHINHHTRTVNLDDSTNLSGTDTGTGDRVPLRPGDRVTVAGILRADGTVVADTISRGRPVAAYRMESGQQELVGRVTQQSNRYTTRDIKVRDQSDHVVTVHVPGGVPVRRDGRPISVHELSKGDLVRITGADDGGDFRADRIEVIRSGD